MGKGIAGLEAAYRGLFTAVLIVLALLVILCLIRAIIGPRIADRIVSVNMMGTMVIVIIAILTIMMGEGYLADICIIYAMISFLAVIVLTKVYMGVYMEKKETGEKRAEAKEKERVRQAVQKESAEGLDKTGGAKKTGETEGSQKIKGLKEKQGIKETREQEETKGKREVMEKEQTGKRNVVRAEEDWTGGMV